MVHEGRTSAAAYFITLTYDESNVPGGWDLRHSDWQEFIKKTRNKFRENRIRYFMCGEYGELGRPHFHAALYGLELEDMQHHPLARGKNADKQFQSKTLDDLWDNKGIVTVAELNMTTAAYMARYLLKSAVKSERQRDYSIELTDGTTWVRRLPYARMSTHPGIGFDWFLKFAESDVYQSGDFVRIEYKNYPAPRYYDRKLEEHNPALYADIKLAREKAGRQIKALHERSEQRRETKAEVKRRQLKLKPTGGL